MRAIVGVACEVQIDHLHPNFEIPHYQGPKMEGQDPKHGVFNLDLPGFTWIYLDSLGSEALLRMDSCVSFLGKTPALE